MAASDTEPIDTETIGEAVHVALWDLQPQSAAEAELLVQQLEGHVGLLAPEVAARIPALDESMGGVGAVVLRQAAEVLDPAAPADDRAARLFDLGTVARALLALIEKTAAPEPTELKAAP